MKVLYDSQIFSAQQFGGISRYYCMLMSRLDGKGVECSLPEMYTNNVYLHDLAARSPGKFRLKDIYNRSGGHIFRRYAYYRNGKENVRALSRGDFDLFHPTYYDPYFLAHLGDRPFVVTVYDMIHEIFPEYFSPDDQVATWKQQLLGRASRIIAISENTRKDILKFYDVDEKKIEVIYLGNSLQEAGPARSSPVGRLPEKYLLFVGDRSLYKNFYLFAESVAPLLKAKPGLRLVCVGGRPFSDQERVFFRHHGLDSKVEYSPANDATLADLYRGALAFVFPSLYEGFGIPVLEAFSCDCPAILSNASSLPEVGGDAAVYFDPKDATSIRDAVNRVIGDAGLREKMIARGRERLTHFSWEKCADETASVYRSLSR